MNTGTKIPRPLAAFSLIELLVAMSILVLLTVFVAMLIDSSGRTTSLWHRRMDAESQARLVMDRLAMDFAQATRRGDVDVNFAIQPGDDALILYGQTTGYNDNLPTNAAPRSLSVIGYRMNASHQLERAARTLAWNEMTFSSTNGQVLAGTNAALPPSVPTVDAGGGSTNYEIFGDQVLRFEYGFLLKPDATTTPPRLQAVLSATPPARLSDIGAIVVACATLDNKARALLTPTQINSLANVFSDFSATDAAAGRDILASWDAILRDPSKFPPVGVPLPLANNVRLYQRYYTLR